MKTITEALESYVNGNMSHIKNWMEENEILLSEMLEAYIDGYNPDDYSILLFVKRLENK